MKSGGKFFLLLKGPVYTNMFSSNLNDCIASTHHFRIAFILLSLETVREREFSKMHWMSLKDNAWKVTTARP